MKRSRDTLTGGTKDVNPQFMNIPLQGRVNGPTAGSVTTYALPKSPLTQNGRAQIIEILKIFFYGGQNAASPNAYSEQMFVCTANPGTAQTASVTDPKCIGFADFTSLLNTSGMTQEDHIKCLDVTDGAGHGILVATDYIFVQQWASNTIVPGTVTAAPYAPGVKILYRYKNVSVQEYIGIVQSQS